MGKFNKYIKILVLMILCFCSCRNKVKPVSKVLDYSYNGGWAYSYSIKVYNNGKAFLKKNNLKTDSLYVKDQVNVDSLYIIMSKMEGMNLSNKYRSIQRELGRLTFGLGAAAETLPRPQPRPLPHRPGGRGRELHAP